MKSVKIIKPEKYNDIFYAYSEEDMINRTLKSEEDITAGRTIKMVDFKQELEEWENSENHLPNR